MQNVFCDIKCVLRGQICFTISNVFCDLKRVLIYKMCFFFTEICFAKVKCVKKLMIMFENR